MLRNDIIILKPQAGAEVKAAELHDTYFKQDPALHSNMSAPPTKPEGRLTGADLLV